MPANDNRIDARDWSLLALLSVLWGGSFFFNGVVRVNLEPFDRPADEIHRTFLRMWRYYRS